MSHFGGGALSKVLVVDDDPTVRDILGRILTRGGHETVHAGTGREALDLLVSDTFDLIITDINMPDVDGIELILAVRDTHEEMPVIAISGGGLIDASSLLRDARELGAVEVVAKPFHVAEIRDLIEKHLAS